MEIFEPLPFNLRSKFRQDIAPTIRQRLEHLWKSAHTMRSTSLSHTLMRQFRAIVDEHGVDLPAYVSNKICQWCAALMIPSVTCRIRVKRLERKSRAQKKLLALNASGGVGKERSETSNSARLKNCIVVTCLLCEHTGAVLPGCSRRPPQSTTSADNNKPTVGNFSSSSTSKASVRGNSGSTSSVTGTSTGTGAAGQPKKRFSFLDSLDRRSSAPGRLHGDFIALGSPPVPAYPSSSSSYSQSKSSNQASGYLKNRTGNSTTLFKSTQSLTNTASRRLTTTTSIQDTEKNRSGEESFDGAIDVTYTIDGTGTGGGASEAVATSTASSSSVSVQFSQGGGDSATAIPGAKRAAVNLLELEKLNRKEQQKRRKTLSGYVSTTTSTSTSTGKLPVTPKADHSLAAIMSQVRGTPTGGTFSGSKAVGVPSPAPSLGTLQGLLSRKKN